MLGPALSSPRRDVVRGSVSEAPRPLFENIRNQELIAMLESCYRDFVLGLRALRKSPVFTLTAVLTLGIGIGANTVVFTLLYGLLLRSLPVKDPGSLVRIGVASATVDPGRASAVPYQMLLQLRRQQKSFTEISAWARSPVALDTDDGAPRLSSAGFVSGNSFEVLGMSPYLAGS
jgi:putative ABC transport system permease protein